MIRRKLCEIQAQLVKKEQDKFDQKFRIEESKEESNVELSDSDDENLVPKINNGRKIVVPNDTITIDSVWFKPDESHNS